MKVRYRELYAGHFDKCPFGSYRESERCLSLPICVGDEECEKCPHYEGPPLVVKVFDGTLDVQEIECKYLKEAPLLNKQFLNEEQIRILNGLGFNVTGNTNVLDLLTLLPKSINGYELIVNFNIDCLEYSRNGKLHFNKSMLFVGSPIINAVYDALMHLTVEGYIKINTESHETKI